MSDDYAAARPKSVVIDGRSVVMRRNLAALTLVATILPVGVQVPSGGLTLTANAPTITRIDPTFMPRDLRKTAVWPAEEWQPPRNLAATAFAAVGANTGVNAPTAALTLTGYAPSIAVGGAPPLLEPGRVSFLYSQVIQPRRNIAAIYQAIISGPQTGQSLAIPVGTLNVLGFAPTIAQATPILSGQDLQEIVQPEVWQPQRRSYLFALSQPGTQSINVPTAPLSVTGFAPAISVTGTLFVPQASLALTGFVPTISQAASGRVDVPLGQITLQGFAPVVGVSGTILIPTGGLTLTAFAPTIAQVPGGSVSGRRIKATSGRTIRVRDS